MPAMRKSFWPVLFVLFCLAVFCLIKNNSIAQEKKQDQKLQYEVQVTLKLVQVYVTDKKGNPVIDLAKEEFSIFDEGKPQKITDYEKHVLVQKEEAQPPAPEIQGPPTQELLPRKFFL